MTNASHSLLLSLLVLRLAESSTLAVTALSVSNANERSSASSNACFQSEALELRMIDVSPHSLFKHFPTILKMEIISRILRHRLKRIDESPAEAVDKKVEAIVSVGDMLALKVRMNAGTKPSVLYQALPMKTALLLADLHRLDGPFFIPHKEFMGFPAHPFSKEFPVPSEGECILDYALQGNQYVASSVRYDGHLFSLAEFARAAEVLRLETFGSIQTVPSSYAYFSPSIKDMRSLAESSGWVPSVSDQSGPSWSDAQKGLKADKSAGVICRIPKRDASRSSDDLETLEPVEFYRGGPVEDSKSWMDFASYQKSRAAVTTETVGDLVRDWATHFQSPDGQPLGVKAWVFYEGMRSSWKEWWDGQYRRLMKHGGMDFKSYLDAQGRELDIPIGTRVPVIADGEVIHLFPSHDAYGDQIKDADKRDFIGTTVVVKHEQLMNGKNEIFYSAYVHGDPTPALRVGRRLKKGDLVVTVADPAVYGYPGTPAHLDLTTFWAPVDFDFTGFTWAQMNVFYHGVTLFDPFLVDDFKRHQGREGAADFLPTGLSRQVLRAG